MTKIPIQIIPFDSAYSQDFAALNIAWLEKYFVVEPHDAALLEKCEDTIVKAGGYIFFAKYKEMIVGTFSLIKSKEGVYELGKMAVLDTYQGRGIGQELLCFSIQYAKQNQWSKLFLYTGTILKNAIHIYQKHGFVAVPLEEDPPYQRSDYKMEMNLT